MSLSSKPKDSKTLSEHSMKAFTKIMDFISQLHEAFCVEGKFHEIELYNHLLGKTKLSNKSAINRHVELFTEFCTRNSNAISARDYKKIVSHRISYSEKVFIDIYKVLDQDNLDSETINSIWNHLLVIQAVIDPTSKAKELLRQFQNSNVSNTSEGQFLNNFLQKVDSNMGNVTNNPAGMGNILQDLVGSIDSGVKNGQLDIGKLVGSVQQMLGGLTSQVGGDSGGVDISQMMGMFGGLMGQIGGNTSSNSAPSLSGVDPDKAVQQIEAHIEAQTKLANENNVHTNNNVVINETKTSNINEAD